MAEGRFRFLTNLWPIGVAFTCAATTSTGSRHGGDVPRAASYLARQALEQSLEEFWQHRAPGVERASAGAQLLCLRSYADEEIAEPAAHAWHALSRACHHYAYELAPTGQELNNWITDVERVAGALSGQ